MRIVAGEFRGRALAAPKTQDIRPTTDRTRQAMFNVIVHSWPEALAGTKVLDLFAGTGALGFEALSRGAASCLFVDDGAEARGLIRENAEVLSLQGRIKIFRRNAADLGLAGSFGPFELCFADPPYGRGLGSAALRAAAIGGWLAPGALCMVEEKANAPFDPGADFLEIDRRAYGETVIRFLTFTPQDRRNGG